MYCSFVQIYNENLFDMLRDASLNHPLAIREDNREIYVQGLSEYNVKSVSDTLQLLKVAEDNRAIRETHMNQFSSRSHSIFQIYIESKRLADDGGEISLRAKFNLVDLAGSEKWNTKQNLDTKHISEMTNINLSLHTLGKCISSLARQSRDRQRENKDLDSRLSESFSSLKTNNTATNNNRNSSNNNLANENDNDNDSVTSLTRGLTGSKKGGKNAGATTGSGHVPYRDSKLTRLLQVRLLFMSVMYFPLQWVMMLVDHCVIVLNHNQS
jgi:PHD/YefM family antitoxin component YafN of YafNO toxin-antitoxin module